MGVEEDKKIEESKTAEEEKKEDDNDKEEAKPAENPAEEKAKPEESKAEAASPPPPPPEILLKVFMHCEGCARKVRRSLKGFPGVEDVITDCKSQKVVVKGEKADPLMVVERVQRKSHRKVELLSPIPKPMVEEEKKPQEEEKPKPEEKKEEPQIVTVVLKVHMHCEACTQEIKRRIQRMKGVESAEPDFKNSQVSVKGVYDPAELVEYVYKRTGNQAVIVKQEPEAAKEKKAEEEKETKEEKKGEEGDNKEKKNEGEEENKEKKEEAVEEVEEAKVEEEEETKLGGARKNEYYYYPQRYGMEMYAYPAYQTYPPQIFSDENPNACSVM